MPRDFAVSFRDADLLANSLLNDYEQSLFLNPQGEDLVLLANLIRKTELQGQLYDTVLFGNQSVSYPRPFLFTLSPTEQHPNAEARQRLSRLLCLYDNAGEHFQPGMDSNRSQATRTWRNRGCCCSSSIPLRIRGSASGAGARTPTCRQGEVSTAARR